MARWSISSGERRRACARADAAGFAEVEDPRGRFLTGGSAAAAVAATAVVFDAFRPREDRPLSLPVAFSERVFGALAGGGARATRPRRAKVDRVALSFALRTTRR